MILDEEFETSVLPGEENSDLQEVENVHGLDSSDNQANDTTNNELKNAIPEIDGVPSDSMAQEEISSYQDAPSHDVALPLDIPPPEDQAITSSQEKTATNEVEATVYHSSTTLSSPSENSTSNLEDSTTDNAAVTEDSKEPADDLSTAQATEVQSFKDDPIPREIPSQETTPEDAPQINIDDQGVSFDEDKPAAQEDAGVQEQPTVSNTSEQYGEPRNDVTMSDNTMTEPPSVPVEQTASDGMTGETFPETTPADTLEKQDSPVKPDDTAENIKVEDQSFTTMSLTSATLDQEDPSTTIQDQTGMSTEAQDPVATITPASPTGEWISLAPKPAATDDAKKDAESCFF